VPVVMMSAPRTNELDKVRGTNAGAKTIQVKKPFGHSELLARVEGLPSQGGTEADSPHIMPTAS